MSNPQEKMSWSKFILRWEGYIPMNVRHGFEADLYALILEERRAQERQTHDFPRGEGG